MTDRFDYLVEILERSGVPFVLHRHAPTRTMKDAQRNLSFEMARIVKTVAFRLRDGRLALAALSGVRRVDYPRLAALIGVNRRDLSPLSPEEVHDLLGVEPGSVSPLLAGKGLSVFIDDEVLSILPTVYCGIGRSDRTLEIAAADLVGLRAGLTGVFSRG